MQSFYWKPPGNEYIEVKYEFVHLEIFSLGWWDQNKTENITHSDEGYQQSTLGRRVILIGSI